MLKTTKILCVVIIVVLMATIVSPIGSFTAFADASESAQAQNSESLTDGWYTSSDGGFKFYVGNWKYYGQYGITLVEPLDSIPTNCCTINVYDADSDEVFENKTKSNFESVLGESITVFEKSTVGNAEYTMYYCSSESYELYTFQANGKKYMILFIWGMESDREELTSFAADAMSTISITGDIEPPVVIDGIKSVDHEIKDGKLVFTVTTSGGDYNRVKVTTSDNLSGSLGVANKYTVETNGDYVWTVKVDIPTATTEYAFDVRSAETNKYLKEYYYYSINASESDFAYVVSDGEAMITCYCGTGGNVIIPSAIDGYPVTAVAEYAFYDNDYIVNVYMPSVESVGSKAFAFCDSLEAVDMPSVKSIAYYAFGDSYYLKKVSMPNVETIGDYAFFWCQNLKKCVR